MAVPVITSITPTRGPACGANWITITGTNFATPTVVYGYPDPLVAPSVRVLVNGETSTDARALSSTTITARVPWYRGDIRSWTGSVPSLLDAYPAVDVTVLNLSSSGVPVAGETATATAAYTFERWVLGSPETQGPITRAVSSLLERLRSEVAKNVHLSVHLEYGDGDDDTERVALPELPGIGMSFSEVPSTLNYKTVGPVLVADPTDSLGDRMWLFKGGRVRDLDVLLLIAGEGYAEAQALYDALEDSIEAEPYLSVPSDGVLDPTLEFLRYEISPLVGATPVGIDGMTAVRALSARFRVYGIEILPKTPAEVIYTIDTITVVEGWSTVTVSYDVD